MGGVPAEVVHDEETSLRDVFWYFLRLGWLAFGGPVGQIGLMHLEVVERRRWLDEEEFIQALNFCHVLPGPEALQLAIYIGWRKRGYLGGALAGVLFILPGFLTLTALGWVYVRFGKRPEVLGVLWGFRPVGLALLVAALVRISRAALKGPFAVALATLAPPERLATNSARSAARRISSGVAPSAGNEAVPADASSERARPVHADPGPTTPLTAARTRSAIGPTWSRAVRGRSTANSSPP